jgi:amino acid transporter
VPDPTAGGPQLKRGLKPLALFGVMFVLVSGGPYGLEEIVPTAGPGLALLVLFGMGFVWAVPYVLIISELVSAIPRQGGFYFWYRAFLNPFWSFQFCCLDWINWVMDAALYPPLIAAYVVGFFLPGSGHFTTWVVCLVVIWGCTFINIRGIRVAGRLSMLLTVLILAPVAVLIVLGLPRISLAHLFPFIPQGTSIHEALNYALIFGVWTYSGYGGLAYASEEIVNPERNYPRVLAIFLPLTIVIYVLPILIGLSATPEWAGWGTGHFNQIAFAIGGSWLALLTAIGAQFGNLGIFNGELLITSRLPWAMAKDGVLPTTFAQLHPRYGTPSMFLILQAILYSLLTYFLDFVEILIVSTWIALPSYIMMFITPIMLRLKRPDLKGPFRIPGGWPVVLLSAFTTLSITLYVMVTAPLREILIGLGFIALAPLLYLWSLWATRRTVNG